MVLIILNEIRFEASKFETRTMPTPDMKGKEMIYWISVDTTDKRLVTELQRFLSGSAQIIELRVPSAFIAAKTELEGYKAEKSPATIPAGEDKHSITQQQQEQQRDGEERYLVEILLRRLLPETKRGQIQPPYG